MLKFGLIYCFHLQHILIITQIKTNTLLISNPAGVEHGCFALADSPLGYAKVFKAGGKFLAHKNELVLIFKLDALSELS